MGLTGEASGESSRAGLIGILSPGGHAAQKAAGSSLAGQLRSAAAESLHMFGGALRQRLEEAGVFTSLKFELSRGAEGELRANSHPRQGEINRVFEQSPDLGELFSRAEAAFRLLRSDAAGQDPEKSSGASASGGEQFVVKVNGEDISAEWR